MRSVLEQQVDLRADGHRYVPVDDLPSDHRYFAYQRTVNEGGAPSEIVVDGARAKEGRDFRDETEGENPVVGLRPVGAR